jgi:hypothetical protein
MADIETRPKHSRKLLRQVLLWTLLLACLGFLAVLLPGLSTPTQLAADDFVEYWSAARLNLTGGNPYASDQMAVLQTEVGKTDAPLMMWNPPWTLAAIMPFGLFSYFSARVLWFLVSICLVFFCAAYIWRVYGGFPDKAWIAWLVGFLFAPTLQAIKVGQIGPVFLLGLVGFMYFEKKQKWWLAGTFAALTLIKPHLLYLFLFAILLWSWRQKNWRVPVSMALTIFLGLFISWVVNPSLIGQYIYAVTHYPPSDYASATLGAVLRALFGENRFWLQFVPPAFGCLWFLVYWRRRWSSWNWHDQAVLVVLVSIATAAYGWTFDYVVLILPMILTALCCYRHGWSARIVWLYLPYVLVNILMTFLPIYQDAYWWIGLGFLFWYLWAQSWFGRESNVQSESSLVVKPVKT